ncbi:MAG TPA: SoxR reducing system RseC family protein [Spirochaetota bacterium]|nr:SoxR reducing system RseC family protein [Spirochaetota bacterium]HOL56831.1 SoxR reducing system RseC family protein [Spirochaetota bacterium]HPP04273.1 SoxR reducing system RseC family protein [Spirochaetota bacterium]
MEKGIIKEIKGNNKVIINLEIENDCAHCALNKNCFTPKNCENLIEAICEDSVSVGEIVEVEISPFKKILFSFIMFFIPIVVIFLFYYFARSFLKNELLSVIFSFIGFILYFIVIILIYKFNPSLLKIKCYKIKR